MLRPTDIDSVWPVIEKVAREAIDGDDCTAEDILNECRNDRALCLAGEDGVVIATLVPNRFKHDIELMVWLAVSVGPHGACERNAPDVDTVARDLGASRIVFHTRRRGWERRLKALGADWKLREVTFVRELQ